MYDVFISHSHKDAGYAQAIAALLEDNGFLVWWDKKLLPGEKFRAKIDTLIDECPAVISIWSPNSIKSDWVMDEANKAAERQKLIPVRIADCSQPMGFREIECYSLLNWSGSSPTDDVEPLIQAVEDRVGHSRGAPQRARLPREIRVIAQRVFLPLVEIMVLLLLLLVIPLIFGEFSNDIAFHAVKLIHIFSAIVLLGGGVMLYLLFRAADLEVDFSSEAAVFKIARRLVYSVWVPSAIVQPITGVLLIYFGGFHWARWLTLSLFLYFATLLLWFLGFRAAFASSSPEQTFSFAPSTLRQRERRDTWIKWALSLNLVTFGLMVYSEQLPHFLSDEIHPLAVLNHLLNP